MPRPVPRHANHRLLPALALWFATAGSTAAAPPDATSTVHPELWPLARSAGLFDTATERRITALLASMSLEEKVGQVVQADIGAIEPDDLRRFALGSVLAGGDSGVHRDDRAPSPEWLGLMREFHAVAVEQRPGHVPIPLLIGIDAVHGHNNMIGSVIFPHNIGLGAAHDPELVRRIGSATAAMVAATGIDWTFAPTLAAPHDVRWGRTYEGYAADPALVRQYAQAMVEGLQGAPGLAHPLQAGHIAATAKHFLGDGATLYGEDEGDSELSEADLVRDHAQGYVGAIRAGVMTVMASFSSWNGQKMHGNRALLTTVLKGRMGFDGFVIGDWNGHAQVPGCSKERCPAAINAGLDMYMAPQSYQALYRNLIEEVRTGEVPAARLDDAVRRILRVKFRLGLFETDRPFEGRLELLRSDEQRALGREAVRKSLVLLKNDGVLPIRGSARVVVSGPQAGDFSAQLGGWTVSWQGADTRRSDFPNAESVARGIRRAVVAQGGAIIDPTDDLDTLKPDVAVIIFGEKPYAEMLGDIKLPLFNNRAGLREMELFRRHGIPVVAVFLSGRPLWVSQEINASNAFVAAWLPGTEGGGIADILVGDANGKPRFDFTGSLPYPWPRAATLPPYQQPTDAREAAFPAGYGLSYAHGGATPPLSEALDGR